MQRRQRKRLQRPLKDSKTETGKLGETCCWGFRQESLNVEVTGYIKQGRFKEWWGGNPVGGIRGQEWKLRDAKLWIHKATAPFFEKHERNTESGWRMKSGQARHRQWAMLDLGLLTGMRRQGGRDWWWRWEWCLRAWSPRLGKRERDPGPALSHSFVQVEGGFANCERMGKVKRMQNEAYEIEARKLRSFASHCLYCISKVGGEWADEIWGGGRK